MNYMLSEVTSQRDKEFMVGDLMNGVTKTKGFSDMNDIGCWSI